MFKNFLIPLWADDRGAILSSEWLAITASVTIPAVAAVAGVVDELKKAADRQREAIQAICTPKIDYSGYAIGKPGAKPIASVGGVHFSPDPVN